MKELVCSNLLALGIGKRTFRASPCEHCELACEYWELTELSELIELCELSDPSSTSFRPCMTDADIVDPADPKGTTAAATDDVGECERKARCAVLRTLDGGS